LVILSPFLFPPRKRREEEKKNEIAKIVIKTHAFQTGHFLAPEVYTSRAYVMLIL
jgi:hypothetical protein